MRSRAVLGRGVLTIAVVLLALSQIGLPAGQEASAQAQVRLRARDAVLAQIVRPMAEKVSPNLGLRVHQFGKALAPGTRIRPAFPIRGKERDELVAENESWLFFIDKQPGAHFAHPVEFALWDAETGKTQRLAAEWWPVINGQPVFDTLAKREAKETIIFDLKPTSATKPVERLKVKPSGILKAHDPCAAWAIIVCGYNDLPDTFDEDTDGIYSVLIGLGLTDGHIFFVSPHTTHPGVDQATSIANVQWAISQVAASADETDKVLFFFSSHGGIDSLSCVPGSAGGGYISASDLDNWLDAVTCDEMTIVVEACHSGSLIGKYANGTYVAAEDDLTGDGETNRCIFTSASTDTSSYPDEDWAGDPNPGDSGSETIWGYVEAFGASSADTNGDTEISFGEAFQYAWDNDITRITGVNTPQMSSTGLNVNNVYDYCFRVAGNKDLFVSDGPGDVGHNSYDYDSTDIWVSQTPTGTIHLDPVSGMTNYVHVAVHNRGLNPVANGSLKVYWANSSTATAWPADFTQIGTTQSFGPLTSGNVFVYVWPWSVDPTIGVGHNFCLVGVSDSPEDPISYPAGVVYIAPFDNNIGQKNITIVEDHGHGIGTAKFVIKNSDPEAQAVDLVMSWVGNPPASAALRLPDDLHKLAVAKRLVPEKLRFDQNLAGWRLAASGESRLLRIPLKPGEQRILTLVITTKNTKPGARAEVRLHQEIRGKRSGALLVRLQEVDPADPGWVARTTVETFSDLAARTKSRAATEVSKIFAELLNKDLSGDEKAVKAAILRTSAVLADLTSSLPPLEPKMKARLAAGTRRLDEACRGENMKAMLLAQGDLAGIVEEIPGKK